MRFSAGGEMKSIVRDIQDGRTHPLIHPTTIVPGWHWALSGDVLIPARMKLAA